ncbi:MAG: autotransporter protein [Herminiimonas sp.]|nr:autotransporter protein [Herminiimonas sp.]
MTYADRVKDTTTTTGTGTITLAGSPPSGFQSFAAGLPASASVPYCIAGQTGSEWEVGVGVLLTGTTLSRSPTASSNSGSLVNFSAGTKDVFCTQSASQIAKLLSSDDVAFALAVPLTAQGIRYMPQQTVSSVQAFTVASSPVKNAQVYVRLIADGTNAPTFTGYKEWGGSLGYDNRNGIVNEITFFYDGYDYWYSVSQAVGATPVVAAPSQVLGLTAGTPTNSTVPLSWSLPTGGGTPTDYIVEYKLTSSGTWLTFSDGTSTALSATVTGLASSSAYDFRVSATNTGGTGAVSSTVSATTAAAATVPATMSAPTATAGDTTASIAFTIPSNGGATITGYTITPYIGATAQTAQTSGTLTSPIVATGLTNSTAYTFKIHANNSVGSGVDSPASNSVTPVAAAAFLRAVTIGSPVTESGTGPYTYTAAGGSLTSGAGIVLDKHFQSGVDGSVQATFGSVTGSNEFMIGLRDDTTVGAWTTLKGGLYAWMNGTNQYNQVTLTGGGPGGIDVASVPASGDVIKLTRTGTTITFGLARAATPTVFATIHTLTGASTALQYVEIIAIGTVTVSGLTSTGLA